MNRHHYALFVRNCRLILLLRRERRSEGDLNIFRPAEFRWKIHQVRKLHVFIFMNVLFYSIYI